MRETVSLISHAIFRMHGRTLFVAVLAGWMIMTPAGAQTRLTAFSGQWQGRGTDKETLFETAQDTNCKSTVEADVVNLTSYTVCTGVAGLEKRIRLTANVNDEVITGTAQQTRVVHGSGIAEKKLIGTISGTRNGDSANCVIRFPDLTPNAHLQLELRSSTSFTMTISSLNFVLTKVIFRRPPHQ
jgi:hypothetical protein